MTQDKILNLINYIVCVASERGIKLTPVRLVKFLYLADLHWAREKHGKTFTGWPWKFVHYGPFCGESLDSIKDASTRGLIEEEAHESKYVDGDYYLYWCKNEPIDIGEFPLFLRSALNDYIDRWGDDTYGLLDHVYFDTEPMIDAAKGDLLDFSKSRKPEKPVEIRMLKLSADNVVKARSIIGKLKSKYKEEQNKRLKIPKPIYDESYLQAVKLLDEDDLKGELSGEAAIIASEAQHEH